MAQHRLSTVTAKLSTVTLGLFVAVLGFAGVVVFDGTGSLVFAGANGIGAILVLGSPRTDSTASIGTAIVLVSWTFMGFMQFTTHIIVATAVGFVWFVCMADMDALREIYRTGTIGKAATEETNEK